MNRPTQPINHAALARELAALRAENERYARARDLLTEFRAVVEDFNAKAKGWMRPAVIGHVSRYSGLTEKEAAVYVDRFTDEPEETAEEREAMGYVSNLSGEHHS